MRKMLAVCLLLLLAAPVFAEDAAAGDPLGSARGAFVALSVGDVAAMSAWYQETLDLKVFASGEAPNKIAKFALLEGSGLLLELIQHTQAQPRKVAAPAATESYQLHGIFKAGLVVADIDQLYSRLKQKNVAFTFELMPAKDVAMRFFAIRDPEGNLLQFFGK